MRNAIKAVKLGWKNYYKYAPVIYMDPGVVVPVPKTFLRDHMVMELSADSLERPRLVVSEA